MTFSKDSLYSLIDELPVNERDKKNLKIASLKEYLGLAEKLSDLAIKK
jgi:hypothetical protein